MRAIASIACVSILQLAAFAQQPGEGAFEETKLSPAPDMSGGQNAGTSVAISGQTIVVGAPGEASGGLAGAGAAYVFVRSGTSWALEQRLQRSVPVTNNIFGEDVAIVGDRLAVAAPGASSPAFGVFIFERQGTTWSQTAQVVEVDNLNTRYRPESLALAQDLLAFRGRAENVSPGVARVYVYELTGGAWMRLGNAVLPSGISSTQANLQSFGDSIAIEDDRSIFVGAPNHDPSGMGLNSVGAAYVFERDSSTNSWNEIDKLLAPTPAPNDVTGVTVSFFGDRLAVGARGAGSSGRVWLFARTGTSWALEQALAGFGSAGGDAFGASVSLSSDRLLVGARTSDSPANTSGSAFLFRRTGTIWCEEDAFTPSDVNVGGNFGTSVALDDDLLAVGEPFDDATAGLGGAAYGFRIEQKNYPDFCFGDGGDQLGCTDCPCANNAPAGTVGGCLNATGTSARLIGSGTACTGQDSLRFDLEGATPNSFANLISGDNQLPANMSNPCFGLGPGVQSTLLDGLRCVGSNQVRHGSRSTDSNGDTINGWGPPNNPAGGLVLQGGFAAGTTRYFQVTYREDPALQCMTGQNTSNGVTVGIVAGQ